MQYINLDISDFSIFRAPLWWFEMPYIDLDILPLLSTRAPILSGLGPGDWNLTHMIMWSRTVPPDQEQTRHRRSNLIFFLRIQFFSSKFAQLNVKSYVKHAYALKKNLFKWVGLCKWLSDTFEN